MWVIRVLRNLFSSLNFVNRCIEMKYFIYKIELPNPELYIYILPCFFVFFPPYTKNLALKGHITEMRALYKKINLPNLTLIQGENAQKRFKVINLSPVKFFSQYLDFSQCTKKIFKIHINSQRQHYNVHKLLYNV